VHVPRRSWKLACVFGFWELCPQTPTGALSLDPAEGIPSPRPPVLSHLANFWLPLLANPVSASDLFIYYYSYMQPHYLSHAHPTRDGLSRSPATYTTGKRTTIYIRYTGWSEKASHQVNHNITKYRPILNELSPTHTQLSTCNEASDHYGYHSTARTRR